MELWKTLERIDGQGFPNPSMELELMQYSNINDFEGYYKVLGISHLATALEIKHAYRKRVKKLHTDVGGEITEYHKVVEAYKALSNPLTRAEYDRTKRKAVKRSDLISFGISRGIELPKVTVVPLRYTYYRGKEETVDYDVVLDWYLEMVRVFNLFDIKDSPRVAVQNLGKAFDWSKVNSKFQIAHFDKSMKPSFIVALAATLKSDKIAFKKGN